MKPINLKLLVFAIVGSFGIGLMMGYFMERNGVKTGQFTLKSGDNLISIDLDQESVEQEVLLEKIFSEDWSKNAAVAWLKNKHNLYLAKDPAIIKEIEKLEINDELSKDLREVSYKRMGPWQYQIDTVQIGFPAKQPEIGQAFACSNGDYYRKNIVLKTLDHQHEIKLEAIGGSYECAQGWNAPDLQVNMEDAKVLFGDSPLLKMEKVLILVIPD